MTLRRWLRALFFRRPEPDWRVWSDARDEYQRQRQSGQTPEDENARDPRITDDRWWC